MIIILLIVLTIITYRLPKAIKLHNYIKYKIEYYNDNCISHLDKISLDNITSINKILFSLKPLKIKYYICKRHYELLQKDTSSDR